MATYVEKGNHLEHKHSKLVVMDNTYLIINFCLIFISLFFVFFEENFYLILLAILSQPFFISKLKEIQKRTDDVRKHSVGFEITDCFLKKLSNDYFIFCDVCMPFEEQNYYFEYIIVGPPGIFSVEVNIFEGNILIPSDSKEVFLQNPSKSISEQTNLMNPLAKKQFALSKLLSKYHKDLPLYSCLFFSNPYTYIFSKGENYYAFDEGEKLLDFLTASDGISLNKTEIQSITESIRKNVL